MTARRALGAAALGAVALAGLGGLGGCRDDRAPRARGAEHAPGAPPYRIEVAPPAACRAGEPCAVEVRVAVEGGFKLNPEYPFRFVPAAADGVTHEGAAFAAAGDHAGALTVTFRAAAPGTARVAGTFKLSVCDPDRCLIEDEPVEVDVPVS